MKKLVLALVCFASLAFFASCVKEGQPTIQVLNQEGFVQDGAVVDQNTNVYFGFVVASSPESKKELSKLVVTIDGTKWAEKDLTGMTEYTHIDTVYYEPERDIVGQSVIQAVVTDAAGQTATATITLSINEPAQPLMARTFEWYRWGNTITGLDEFGLEWKGNYPKDTYAKLIPQDGVKLFIFEAKDWNEVTTDVEKAAFFNKAIETQHTADEYFEVNVTQMDMTYNDVIGTVMPDGTCHLIHITKSHAEYVAPTGTKITITGEAK